MKSIQNDLLNTRFGKLIVIEVIKNRKVFRCKCNCGNHNYQKLIGKRIVKLKKYRREIVQTNIGKI